MASHALMLLISWPLPGKQTHSRREQASSRVAAETLARAALLV